MIIILNGPPGCGKDTIGNMLHNELGCFQQSFKGPMFKIAEASLGPVLFKSFMEDYNNRETKETAKVYLGGFSPREFFIHISERWCKPVFGDDYFGNQMLDIFIQHPVSMHVVTDGGFPREVDPLLLAGLPVLIVRLHRKGFSFDGDSRNYLRDDSFSHIPKAKQPTFLDIELEDGNPQAAFNRIQWSVYGQA